MPLEITYGEGTTIGPPSLDDYDFSVTQEKVVTPVNPSVSEETQEQDRIVKTDTDATIDEDAQVSVGWIAGNLIETPVVFESLDETIGTVNGEGFVKRVSDGSVGILARGDGLTKRVNVSLARIGGQTAETFERFATGSANAHINAQVENRLASADVADGLNLFSTKNIASQSYVRNVNHWAYGIDLTAISPASSLDGVFRTTKQCTLITPRHYIFSKHYGVYPVGTVVYFVKADGTSVPVTIAGHHSQVGSVDSLVGLLASEPADITPMKMLPTNWGNYLPSLSDGIQTTEGVVGGRYNQDDWLMAGEAYRLQSFRREADTNSESIKEFYGGYATESAGGTLGTIVSPYGPGDLRGGDSGGPGIVFVNGEPTLTTTWTSGYGGSGPDLNSNIANINSAIAAVDASAGISTGYTVGAVDLSEFIDYS